MHQTMLASDMVAENNYIASQQTQVRYLFILTYFKTAILLLLILQKHQNNMAKAQETLQSAGTIP